MAKEINNTGVNLDNLKQRFGSNAQAIYDYANGLNGATANAKGLSSAIGRATIAQKAHTIAVTAGQIALNAFIGLGVGLAINGIISALDALIVTQDELDDKVIESKNNYESSKQALADVNTELENNQKQIDELLGKGKLTYVEQAELDKLKEATKELESQKKLKENEVSKDQRELAIDTANSSKKYTNIGTNTFQEELDFYKKSNNDYTGSSWDSDSNAILPNIQRYEQLKQQLSEITAGTNEWAEKSSEVNEQETKLQDLLTSITEDLSNYELEVQKIKKTEESTWDSNDKKIIKSYEYAQEYYDLLRNTLDPKQYKADQLEKVFNSKDIEKTKKELVEMARKGDLKNLNVDEMPKLKEAMEEAGISAEELKYELEAIADDPLATIDNNANSLTELSSTIQTVTEDLENLNLAIEESVSSSGMTQESIDNIISMFAGLDGYDASELFENTANGIHLNAEELRKLTAEYKETQSKKYTEDLKDLREQYQELCIDIANATTVTEKNQLVNQRNTLQNQIDQAEQLQAQFKGLTSAYTQWEEAMSSPNEGDTYMSVVNNLKDIQELYKQGLVGTDDFRASVQLMSNQDLSTASVEKLMSEYEKGLPKMKRYFQESSDGVLNFLKDLEKANSEFAHMNKDGSWDINFNDEAIAKAMNLNVETIQQIGRRLMDYGFDINFDDSIDELYELRDAADKALDSFKDKKFKIDLDADGVDEINKQLDKIDEKREEINNSDLEPKVKTDQLEDLDDLESYLQAKLGEMADKQYVIDIEANRDQLDESLEKLRELELIDAKVEIDFDSESAQYIGQEIEAIEGVLEDLYGTDGEIDLSVKGAQEATDILIALINKQTEINNKSVVMDVDTSKLEGETQTVLTKLQEIQQAYNTLNSLESLQATGKVSIDDSEIEAAQANVNTLVNDLMKKHPELTADLKLNKETFQADLQGLTANDLVVRANVDSTAIKNYTPDQKTMTVKGNTSDVDNKLKKIDENVKKNRTIQFYQNGLTTIQNYLNNIKSKTVTVTVRQSGSVNLNGSSRLNGTAYAGGNIGAKKTEVALTGEEKPELRVNAKTGRWELLGKDGAEFAKINKGDIIFNGDQTEKLFKNGKILGRGKSFLKGTVGSLASIFGKGSGKSYFSGSGTLYSNGKVKTTTSSKKSSTKKNTKKSSSSADEFLETWDYIEIAIDRIEEQISRLDTKASSVYRSWSSRNSNLTSQMSKIRQEIDLQNKAYNKYMSEANKINLSSSYKDKLKNGQISLQDITDKDLNSRMKEYLDLVNKAENAKTAVIELQEDLSDAYAQRFENVITYWEARVEQVESLMGDIETMVDMNEAKGMFSSKDYYETLIKMENDNIANLQNERNELINAMNEALDSGAIVRYSESWYGMQNQINDVNSAILEANQSLVEFNNSIRDLDWEIFDYLQEQVSTITTESDFLLDLLSGKKMFDENGKNTQFADASFGLMGINYNTYMTQADEYRKAIEELDDTYKNDSLNKDYLERRQELLELQQESILNAEDEKQSIIDLIEEGYNAQLEALEKLIDKRKEYLDNEKAIYDYQKKIAEKTKNIAQIEKQLNAYSTDDSEENQKTVQDLKNELQEAKDDLEETEYEKYLDDQEALLDALYSSFEEWISVRLDNVDRLISETITSINENSSSISETITSATTDVGYTLSDSMKEIMNTDTNNSNNVVNMLSTYNSNFTSKMTTLQSAIDNIKANVAAMVNKANAEAAKQQQTQQQQQANQGSNYGTGTSKPSTSTSTRKPSSSSSSSKKGYFFVYKKDSYPKNKLQINTSIN